MKTEPNEPASPVEVSIVDGNIIGNQTSQFSYFATGLTKREHYTGIALQGIMANGSYASLKDNQKAEYAVIMADLVIAELNRTQD